MLWSLKGYFTNLKKYYYNRYPVVRHYTTFAAQHLDKFFFLLDYRIIDATRFASLHPGGIELFQKYRNTDITVHYKFHSKKARNTIRNLQVAVLSKNN